MSRNRCGALASTALTRRAYQMKLMRKILSMFCHRPLRARYCSVHLQVGLRCYWTNQILTPPTSRPVDRSLICLSSASCSNENDLLPDIGARRHGQGGALALTWKCCEVFYALVTNKCYRKVSVQEVYAL